METLCLVDFGIEWIGMVSMVTDRLATITSVGQGDTGVSAPPIRSLGWSRGELTAFLTVLVNKAGAQLWQRRSQGWIVADPSLAWDIGGKYDLILVQQLCPNPTLVGRAHIKLDIPFPRLWVG